MRRIVAKSARRDDKTNEIDVRAVVEEIEMRGESIAVLSTGSEIVLKGATPAALKLAAGAHLQQLAKADAEAKLSEMVVGKELARL